MYKVIEGFLFLFLEVHLFLMIFQEHSVEL